MKLKDAIEMAKHEYALLKEVAYETGFDNVENSAHALRTVIEAAEEIKHLRVTLNIYDNALWVAAETILSSEPNLHLLTESEKRQMCKDTIDICLNEATKLIKESQPPPDTALAPKRLETKEGGKE